MPAPARAADAPAKLRLVVTYLTSIPAMAALKVAEQRGYFRDTGLELDFASANGGGDTLRPVTTGDADLTIGSPAASTLAAMRDPTLRIAAIWLPRNDFYIIGMKPLDPMNGAKIGAGVGASTSALLVQGLAAKLGVTFDVQKAGTGSMADSWDAVKAGLLQGGWALEPFVTQIKQQDHGMVVIDPVQYLPDFADDFVVVNRDFAAAHGDALKGFFVAIERIFGAFSDPAQHAALAKDLAGVMVFPEAYIRAWLDGMDPQRLAATYTLKMNPAVLKTTAELMQNAKLMRGTVDWAKLVDQSFLPAHDQVADLK